MNRKNITRLAFAIVIVSFVLSTIVSLLSLKLMAERNIQELNKALASRIYDSISSELSEPITVSRSMANDSLLIDSLKKESSSDISATEPVITGYLSRLKNTFGYESAFVVSDKTKIYYSYEGINKQMDLPGNERDQWYTHFLNSGREYDLDVDLDELSQDKWTVFVDTRIEDESGRLLGVCGVGSQITGNQDLFLTLERDYNVKINLIDAEGLIKIDTDESRIEKEYLTNIRLGDNNEYVYQNLGSDGFAVSKYIDKLDWYLVVQSNVSTGQTGILNVLFLNILLCIFVLIIMLLAIRIIIERTRTLTNASFIDQSTQLLNRRAFEERKAELALSRLPEDFVYITADLNGLKGVNDTLGHAAGDELIKGAADCLKACLGNYGQIYRIGGDEFAAMLVLSEKQYKDAMADLEQTTEKWCTEQIKGLSISCGHASTREFPSENIGELSRISDERMYAAKDEYYRKTGKARR